MQESLVKIVTEINHQILSMINHYARHDLVCAQVVFGLPQELTTLLAKISSLQIERLSRAPICLLTLRNCGEIQYWQKLIKCSEYGTEPHQINLRALCMIHSRENKLYVHDRDCSAANQHKQSNSGVVLSHGDK